MSTYNPNRQKEISAIQSVVELKQLNFDAIPQLSEILDNATLFCKAKGAVISLFTKDKFWIKLSSNFDDSKFHSFFSEIISSPNFKNEEKIVEVFTQSSNESFVTVALFDENKNKIGVVCLNSPDFVKVNQQTKLYLISISNSVEYVIQKELINIKHQLAVKTLDANKKTLLQRENLIKYTYDFAPIGMLKTTLSGEVLMANNTFKSMIPSGYTDLVGKPWFLDVIEKENVIEKWYGCTASKEIFTFKCSFHHPNNKKCILDIHASPLVTIDGEIRYLLFVTDITQKVKEEEKSRKMEEVKQLALEKKEAFLANMSHEIRSPMNAILGFADILNETLVNKKQKEYINVIQTAGQNLLAVINNILEYSKSENGKIKIADEVISFADVERNVYTLLKNKAESKNLNLSYKVSNLIPSNLKGDIVLINQVLVNLVDNAIKFTDAGKVDLILNLVKDDINSSSIQFIVNDNGVGISEEAQQLVFDRYYQVKEGSRKYVNGTGLGLNISKNLIEEMGGEIILKSEVGKGSEFSFVLDFKKEIIENKKSEKVIDLISKNTEKIKILIFEDNELNKQLMQHIVNGFGFDLDVAVNGKVGIELLRKNTYDLVIMDLDMPIMDGYEATKMIRTELNLNVPIVALTGHKIVGEKEKCLSIGMNDFISKPINKSELFEKIANLTFTKLNSDDLFSINTPTKTNNTKSNSYLRNLSNGDISFEKEMINVFIKTIPEKMEKLQNAVIAKDSTSIHKLTHNIRGSIAIMGIPFAAEMLTEMDVLSIDNQCDRDLERKFGDVDNIVKSYCELYKDEVLEKKEGIIA